MHKYAKPIPVAAAAFLVAVLGCQSPSGSGASVAEPTASPTSPAVLARGTFVAKGGDVELEATGAADAVTGTMTVSHDGGTFSVDLRCARTADDGRILIGGDTTASTDGYAAEGTRTLIALKPGSPVHAAFAFEEATRPAADCGAFLDELIDAPYLAVAGPDALEPITGSVDLAP